MKNRWTALVMLALMGCGSDADGDGFKGDEDCDDTNAAVYVGAPEVCDGADNDCDGEVDNGASDALTFYADTDGDTFGDAATTQASCERPAGFVADATDCDDSNGQINPSATEICNDLDDNCDDVIDTDATDRLTFYADTDSDGLGDPTSIVLACELPTGAADNMDDCDDTDAIVLDCCSEPADDGDLILTGSDTIVGDVYWYDRVVVPAGATLTVTGDQPLRIYANDVVIEGVIDLSGSDGAASGSTSLPNGGDAGAGGGGGGGGGDCGNGSGLGGAPNGGDAQGDSLPAGDGGLPTGLIGGTVAFGGEWNCGSGGGGGGHSAAGATGLPAFDGCPPIAPASQGGEPYGSEDLSAGLFGGGGGSGGGANGGGGGGGGGAVSIFANTIDIPGLVDVTGGNGGSKLDGSCGSGGGGAGAGGTIWLHADRLVVSGALDASPGEVAPLNSTVSLDGLGGVGAPGRVRISGVSRDITGTVVTGSRFEDDSRATCDAS